MCNCIEKIEEDFKNNISSKNKEYSNMKIERVYCNGSAYIFTSNGTESGLSIPFTLVHEPIGRRKNTVVNAMAKYCPFCGEKYIKESDANE